MVQGGLWDPDAGLVIRVRRPSPGKLVDQAEKSGKLKAFANTPAKSLIIKNGRIKSVVTDRGTIHADYVVVCEGLWGRLIAEMAGEDPAGSARSTIRSPSSAPMPEFARHRQGDRLSAAAGTRATRPICCDTGDPTASEGGMIEWGYYEETQPAPLPTRATSSKSTRRGCRRRSATFAMEQIIEPLERAIELDADPRRAWLRRAATPSTASCRCPPPAARPSAKARR